MKIQNDRQLESHFLVSIFYSTFFLQIYMKN